jgi:hypothetical protein
LAASGIHVRASVHITARSYTYMVNEINRICLEAIAGSGLDPSEFIRNQTVIEHGLRTWVTLRQLEAVHLEVFDPVSGQVRTRIDLNVVFGDSGDDRYLTEVDRIRSATGQVGDDAGCGYRVAVSTTPGAAHVAGWREARLGDISHLAVRGIGEIIATSSTADVRMAILSLP